MLILDGVQAVGESAADSSGSASLVARLVCLVFALAILVVGMREPSVALAALAAGIVAISLAGLCDGASKPPPGPVAPPRWTWRHFNPRQLTLAGCAAASCTVAVAFGTASSPAPRAVSVAAWLATLVPIVALGLSLDRLSLADVAGRVRALWSSQHLTELASVLAIVLVALVLRFYDLEMVPVALHGDEGEMGRIALDILGGEPVPFFKPAPFWGPTYPYNYLQAGVIWAFGSTVAPLRAVSALSGVLCVPVVYALGRVGWGSVAGAMAAWLLAVNHLHIHYSRLAQTFMSAGLLTALTVLLLVLAGRQARLQTFSEDGEPARSAPPTGMGLWTMLLLAGAVAGIAQHIYNPSRLVVGIAALLLLYMVRACWIGRWHVAAFAFGFVLMFAPLAAYYLEAPADFVSHLGEVSAFQSAYIRGIFRPDDTLSSIAPELLAVQVSRTLGLFVRGGDASGFYVDVLPAFDVITACLIWLGLGAALARFRRFPEAAVLTWLGVDLLFANVLTSGPGHAHRTLMVLPAAFVLGGIAVVRAWDVLRLSPLARVDWLLAPAGTTLALWVVAANVGTYFYDYLPRAESAEATMMAREMRREPRRYHVYFLTDPVFDPNAGAVKYIAYGIPAENLKRVADFQRPPPDGLGMLFFALEARMADLKAIEERLPGGEERRVTAPNGRLLYMAYRLPPSR